MKAKSTKKQAPKVKSDEPAPELSVSGFWQSYAANSTPRTRLIDSFLLYLVTLISFQLFYRMVVGDDFPRNAFVSGIFCPLGVAVLLITLRSRGLDFRQLAEFFLAAIVLFVASINFAG